MIIRKERSNTKHFIYLFFVVTLFINLLFFNTKVFADTDDKNNGGDVGTTTPATVETTPVTGNVSGEDLNSSEQNKDKTTVDINQEESQKDSLSSGSTVEGDQNKDNDSDKDTLPGENENVDKENIQDQDKKEGETPVNSEEQGQTNGDTDKENSGTPTNQPSVSTDEANQNLDNDPNKTVEDTNNSDQIPADGNSANMMLATSRALGNAPANTTSPVTPGETPAKDINGYNYDAQLDKNPDHPGVYVTGQLVPNELSDTDAAVIGFSSIADKNLTTPTTESPAIIQGAAVGYEIKTGPTSYDHIKDRDYPYAEFLVTTIEEKGQDGTTHTKLSGYDKTYVIARLDVSKFFTGDVSTDLKNDYYLHVKMDDNRALMPSFGMESKNDQGKTNGGNSFTDSLGNRAASYSLKYLLNRNSDNTIPYVDVILYSTSSIVAGADAGKENVPNGDVPIKFYVDKELQYNELEYDATKQYTQDEINNNFLGKFFNAAKATADAVTNFISKYIVKGSELKLETAVENSDPTGKETTYWSLQKSFEDSYYDLPEDSDPTDPGCGRTVKLINEVAITDNLELKGADSEHLKKRTLDVNTFDVQVANNSSESQGQYTDGFTLENGWLTIADNSRTTGAEVAIGNNAKFTIANGGKLFIDDSCQLEVEWDGASTAPGTEPVDPSVLNNGKLDLQAGGELINNGVITIEGYEGKPTQPGQQPADQSKGCGEMSIAEGATLTNNGSFVVNGKLYNLGTLVNNGSYNDVLTSNDPDKGLFEYHKGIIISWKDDVTQPNVKPGNLTNGMDENGTKYPNSILVNNGSILMVPGTLDNYSTVYNNSNGSIYMATVTEAIIPIEPDPNNPTVVQKRIVLDKPQGSFINNYGTIYDAGNITTATVELRDNLSLGRLTTPGDYPEYSWINNYGTIISLKKDEPDFIREVILDIPNRAYVTRDGITTRTELIMYNDGSFDLMYPNKDYLYGWFGFYGNTLVFVLPGDIVILPTINSYGNFVYRFKYDDDTFVSFVITRAEMARYLLYYQQARTLTKDLLTDAQRPLLARLQYQIARRRLYNVATYRRTI